MKTQPIFNKATVQKLIKTIKPGLSCGLGNPEPGEMCIEAAVCYSLGLPHGDNPPCVEAQVLCEELYAAKSAKSAEYAAKSGEKILIKAAKNCLEVLKEMKSPGCKYLYLI
jgi:hypothetical protein